jgi:hypothetical protein
MYELRQDMNKLLKHQGLSFNAMLPPPPIFPDFPKYTVGDSHKGPLMTREKPIFFTK